MCILDHEFSHFFGNITSLPTSHGNRNVEKYDKKKNYSIT